MCGGIADIGGDGLHPMGRNQGVQAPFDLGKGLLPGRLFESAPPANSRGPQAIRILVKGPQADAFGATVATTPDIIRIRANLLHPALADFHPQAAHRLA